MFISGDLVGIMCIWFLQILNLLEQLCKALNDEFRTYMPKILPRFIQALSDAERNSGYACVPPILHTLEVFGSESLTLLII